MNVNIFSYTATNVTTSAYVTLLNSISTSVSHLQICDTSGELLVIAKGLIGAEVDICTTPIGSSIVVPIFLEPGDRLSIKAITNTAVSGYNAITFLNN